jgi:phosphoribosyl 1,2-cyclic phosphodiesterase
MQVTFWGVRGSAPAPLTPDEVTEKIIKALAGATCDDIKDIQSVTRYVERLSFPMRATIGGNTSCVEVSDGDTEIILDAGSAMRRLGAALSSGDNRTIHIFLSHCHWDHIRGFPFFLPAYVQGNHIFLYAAHHDAWNVLQAQQNPATFPVTTEDMKASIRFIPLEPGGSRLIGDVTVSWIRLRHPGDSYAYRLESRGKSVVYATDGEYDPLSNEEMNLYAGFFSGCDMLIFDGMYLPADAEERRGWGHSTASMGVHFALKAGAKRLVLFHHEHSYNDEQIQGMCEQARQEAEKLQKNDLEIIAAYEGLQLSL